MTTMTGEGYWCGDNDEMARIMKRRKLKRVQQHLRDIQDDEDEEEETERYRMMIDEKEDSLDWTEIL